MEKRVRVGTVMVDSGTVMIGDPCYTATGDASHHIETWREFCDRTPWGEKPYDVTEPAGTGIGLSIPTYWGDGSYPVYAEVKNGRIARVTVDFDPEYDDEDESDEERGE